MLSDHIFFFFFFLSIMNNFKLIQTTRFQLRNLFFTDVVSILRRESTGEYYHQTQLIVGGISVILRLLRTKGTPVAYG